eukprot:1449091-Prymnesium_polylepis.1
MASSPCSAVSTDESDCSAPRGRLGSGEPAAGALSVAASVAASRTVGSGDADTGAVDTSAEAAA